MNVYLLGHGFVHLTSRVLLKRPLTTYVRDGEMLDGRGVQNLVDAGQYNVVGPETEEVTHPEGSVLRDHLLCSDMSTLRDVQGSARWTHRNLQNARRVLSADLGVVFRLDAVTSIYTTMNGVLTRLSDIQDALSWHFSFEPFHMHWAACRSRVGGKTREAIRLECTSDLAKPQRFKELPRRGAPRI